MFAKPLFIPVFCRPASSNSLSVAARATAAEPNTPIVPRNHPPYWSRRLLLLLLQNKTHHGPEYRPASSNSLSVAARATAAEPNTPIVPRNHPPYWSRRLLLLLLQNKTHHGPEYHAAQRRITILLNNKTIGFDSVQCGTSHYNYKVYLALITMHFHMIAHCRNLALGHECGYPGLALPSFAPPPHPHPAATI